MSTPAAGRPVINSSVASGDGSPAIMYETNADFPSAFNLANFASIRDIMNLQTVLAFNCAKDVEKASGMAVFLDLPHRTGRGCVNF